MLIRYNCTRFPAEVLNLKNMSTGLLKRDNLSDIQKNRLYCVTCFNDIERIKRKRYGIKMVKEVETNAKKTVKKRFRALLMILYYLLIITGLTSLTLLLVVSVLRLVSHIQITSEPVLHEPAWAAQNSFELQNNRIFC